MSFLSTTSGVAVVDTRSRPGTITLPLTSQIPNRYLQIKDLYGSFGRSSLTISTQSGESFDDGTTSKILTDPFSFFTLYAASTTRWAQLGGTQTIQQTVSSLLVSSITIGTGTFQQLSTQNINLSTINGQVFGQPINSTVIGLGSAGYISSAQLISTTAGLIEVPELVSSIVGLGSVGYISSAQLISTTAGLIEVPELVSSIVGLGSVGYISSAQLISTTAGLIEVPELVSSIVGLGSVGYISSAQLISTTFGLVEVPELVSSIVGLGSVGYISSAQLISTTSGLIEVPELVSSIVGLGSVGYISSAQLISTTSGLIEVPELVSSIVGLGSLGYISSAQLISTTSGLVEIPELTSSIAGLATAGYISTSQLVSTVAGIGSGFTGSTNSLSAGQIFVSSITALTVNVSTTSFVSSLTVNSLQFGDGTGWVNIGPLQTIAISSVQENTNTLYANNILFGSLSTQTDIQFFGLQGAFNNTVIAEVSTGAGTQEFLVFKGSSASDRVRFQTTGNFVVETGVSARLWNSNTIPTLSNATPAFIINTNSNVGIQTASPGATLDVAGTGRFQSLSTQQLFASSFLANTATLSSLTLNSLSSSNINTISLSSAQVSISSLVTRDQNSANPFGLVYQKSTFLYYNNFIFAGTRQAFGQILTLGIGTGSGGSVATYTSNLTTYTVHSFLTTGSFVVSAGNLYADVFVLAGGGGGGGQYGGGGGAGGFIYAPNVLLTSGNYTTTVGLGGSGTTTTGIAGNNSVFTNGTLTYTGFGGGFGGSYAGTNIGGNGGCGGGGAGNPSSVGGTGSQGFSGGVGGGGQGGAGGGGMGAAGSNSTQGNGGIGSTITITGSAVIYGGGGGGGNLSTGPGGSGGGGSWNGSSSSPGSNGLGGGGGGGGNGVTGSAGGSGIIIIRYPPG